MSAQGRKRAQQLKLYKNDKNSKRRNGATKKTNVFKIECCGSFSQLPAENKDL
jgi:hypothetical protein